MELVLDGEMRKDCDRNHEHPHVGAHSRHVVFVQAIHRLPIAIQGPVESQCAPRLRYVHHCSIGACLLCWRSSSP